VVVKSLAGPALGHSGMRLNLLRALHPIQNQTIQFVEPTTT
jgi:hypothetical protein